MADSFESAVSYFDDAARNFEDNTLTNIDLTK